MKKILSYILLFFIVTISTTFCWLGKVPVAFIFSITSFAAILIANLDKLEFIKFYGLEANLKATISEANATIAQLKSLAIALAEPAISLIATNGISPPMPLVYRMGLVNRINEILTSLEISNDDIQRMNDVHNAMLRMLHGRRIVAGINDVPPNLHIRELENGQGLFASPNDYQEYLTHRGLLTQERRELILDLEHFIEHRQFRRPDLWSNE